MNYDKRTRIGYCSECGARIRKNRDRSYPRWTIIDESEDDYGPTYEYSKPELKTIEKVQILIAGLPNLLSSHKPRSERDAAKIDMAITELAAKIENCDLRDPAEWREVFQALKALHNRLIRK